MERILTFLLRLRTESRCAPVLRGTRRWQEKPNSTRCACPRVSICKRAFYFGQMVLLTTYFKKSYNRLLFAPHFLRAFYFGQMVLLTTYLDK